MTTINAPGDPAASPTAASGGLLARWRRPEVLLLLMAAGVPLSFATWQALINNFAYERAAFGGVEIGIMQSLREVPGFLAFGVVFLLLLIREQRLAVLSLALLGIGTAVTGFFPSVIGIYVPTVVMSLGYHYYETLQISLSLQWIDKVRAPETLGRLIAAGDVLNDIDGVRVSQDGGWWLLRASNTQDILVVRCEAPDAARLQKLMERVRGELRASGLELPFEAVE